MFRITKKHFSLLRIATDVVDHADFLQKGDLFPLEREIVRRYGLLTRDIESWVQFGGEYWEHSAHAQYVLLMSDLRKFSRREAAKASKSAKADSVARTQLPSWELLPYKFIDVDFSR